MALTPLERAVLLTVAYTQQFAFPLTLFEIKTRLLMRAHQGDEPFYKAATVTNSLLTKTVRTLIKKRRLATDQDYFFLAGHRSSVTTRQKRAQVAKQKWPEVQTFVAAAKQCPWITGIFVTGSLAMDNTRPDDDLDFMIVTQPNRLWLSRLWVTLIAWRHGKRRSWHGEEKRSWCFNLWVTEDHLDVFAAHPSLYVAYELHQARSVFDAHQVKARLYANNRWATQFLPLAGWPKVTSTRQEAAQKKSWLVDLLEKVVFSLQWMYMRSHITREKVSLKWAFFHPRDTEASVQHHLHKYVV